MPPEIDINLETDHLETDHLETNAIHGKTPCLADVGFTDAELEQLDWGIRGGFAPLPAVGSGYSCYEAQSNCYGLPEVVQAIQSVCTTWNQLYPNGPRVGIGDISHAAGGVMPPHRSHQHGVDVDVALVANTHEEIALTWDHPRYSRQRTQELIDLFHSNPVLGIRVIFFNDPEIRGVEFCSGHDNHFHVSFLLPGVATADYSSDRQGDLRRLTPYMQGDRVLKLQSDLVSVGIPVTVDGIFGSQTDAAVRQFQTEQRLEIDGIAGKITQAKLAQLIRDRPMARATQSASLTLDEIADQNRSIPFEDVNAGVLVDDPQLCTEIQTILHANLMLEVVDGLYGPKTRESLRRFKASRHLGGGDVLGATTAAALLAARPGSGQLPNWQGGDKAATIEAIVQEAHRQKITASAQIAYILATVQHETGDSFQPVREAYYLGEPKAENYRNTLRYSPYYGRGYVQLTWDYNYRQYSNLLNLDLINQPDLVLRPDVSLFVLIDGMKRGVFTGVGLDDYITGDRIDFLNARRIINATDQAELIAGYASDWQVNLG